MKSIKEMNEGVDYYTDKMTRVTLQILFLVIIALMIYYLITVVI